MEPNEIQAALASAVEEVLETMCFTGVLSSAEGPLPPQAGGGAPRLNAELHFQGNPSGGFRVSVPMKLARAVGAGFLGREETEVSDSQAGEVVCELANMICGTVVSRLDSKAIFRLTHPKLTSPEHGVGVEGTGTERWFDVGDGTLTASLELQQAI